MKQLVIDTKNYLIRDQYNEIIQICERGIEKLSDLGPSDNDVILSLHKKGKKFMATIKMASLGLMFNLKAASHSPLTAVEQALREARQKIDRWSALR